MMNHSAVAAEEAMSASLRRVPRTVVNPRTLRSVVDVGVDNQTVAEQKSARVQEVGIGAIDEFTYSTLGESLGMKDSWQRPVVAQSMQFKDSWHRPNAGAIIDVYQAPFIFGMTHSAATEQSSSGKILLFTMLSVVVGFLYFFAVTVRPHMQQGSLSAVYHIERLIIPEQMRTTSTRLALRILLFALAIQLLFWISTAAHAYIPPL